MADLKYVTMGLFGIHDSGPPPNNENYPTLVLTHGFVWYSNIFSKIIPFAHRHGVRVILLNRRDYPGSIPFSEDEVRPLSIMDDDGVDALRRYVRDRAFELYEFLEILIETENIPLKGGIVLAGWSLGAHFVTAFLAHAPSFPVGDVSVVSYIRSVVSLDFPAMFLGFPNTIGGWHPMTDTALPPEEGIKIFPRWTSGYFMHGDTLEGIERRNFSRTIPPTLDTMSAEEIEFCLHPPPGEPEGSDTLLAWVLLSTDIAAEIRRAIIVPEGEELEDSDGEAVEVESEWSQVKYRHIWGEHSTWSEVWATVCLQDEYEVARKAEEAVRDIEFVQMKGANHFAGWALPEKTLLTLLDLDPDY